jgi:hypothetical protein
VTATGAWAATSAFDLSGVGPSAGATSEQRAAGGVDRAPVPPTIPPVPGSTGVGAPVGVAEGSPRPVAASASSVEPAAGADSPVRATTGSVPAPPACREPEWEHGAWHCDDDHESEDDHVEVGDDHEEDD